MLMKIKFICLLIFLCNISRAQDIRIGGQTLRNIEQRAVFSSRDEKKIRSIDVSNLGVKKIGLVYLSENSLGFRKTSPLPTSNQFKEIALTPNFQNRIDSVINGLLTINKTNRIEYLHDHESLSLEDCFEVRLMRADFRNSECRDKNFKILLENNFDAVILIYEQKIPDYFTRTNTRFLEAKGYFSTLKKTLVYQSLLTRFILLNPKPEFSKVALSFQQLSAKLIEQETNLNYEEFTEKFGANIENILLNQISNNINEIIKVYNPR